MNLYKELFMKIGIEEDLEKISDIAEQIHRGTFFSCEEVINGIVSIIKFNKKYNKNEELEYKDYLKFFHIAISLNMSVDSVLYHIEDLNNK